jgi:hypothetical protein
MSYYSAPYTFDFSDQIILVDGGSIDLDCIALYTACKLAQASLEGIIHAPIALGSGLQTLGPGVQVGVTVKLLGTWQLKFPTGNYIARVSGGNLVGGPGGDPIAYSAGVQTLLIQSAAGTVTSLSGTVPTAEEVAAAILAATYEGTESVRDYLRLTRAPLLAKDRGTATHPQYESADGSKVRVAGIITDGVRSAVTVIDPS